MNAIILARVSTKEQEDTNSIPAQVQRITEYAQRIDLRVDRVVQLVESSTKSNRNKYQEVITNVRNSEETVAIIVDTVDRLQRDFRESVQLDELRREGKVELHFLRENLVINQKSNSSDILRWDMGVMFAKSYVTQLSDNVKRSINQKIQKGEWIGKAPFGYKNADLENGNKWVVIDAFAAEAVKTCFEWYATGNQSLLTIKQKLLSDFGFNYSKSQIDNMLKNSFYCGFMHIKEQRYPHNYDRIIDRELFDKAQNVRKGYQVKPRRWAGLPYAYRGLISCSNCGCRITFEKKKQKYIYGHCTQFKGKHNAKYVSEDFITLKLAEVFKSIQIPEYAYKQVGEALRASHEDKKRERVTTVNNLDGEIKKYKKRIDRVYEDYIDEKIPEELYKRKFDEFNKTQENLQNKRINIEQVEDEHYGTVNHLLNLSRNAPKLFKKANIEQKRTLVRIVLSNLKFDGSQLLWELKKPFDTMAFCYENSSWLRELDSNQRPRS